MPTRLTGPERDVLDTTCPGWALAPGTDAIRREFKFKNFSQAWGFMTRVALLAEKLDHHPDWSNMWNVVRIELSTHDVSGLSENDVRLARAINALLV